MFSALIKWAAKKYAINALNDLLSKNKEKVKEATSTLALWSYRLTRVAQLVANLNVKVSDGNLSNSEAENAIDEIDALVKGW